MPDIQTGLTTLTQRFSIEPTSLARPAEKKTSGWMLRRAQGPPLTTASGLINGVQGRVMSGINLTEASGGGICFSVFHLCEISN